MTYYFYIDDSGNIDVQDPGSSFFVYSAIIFKEKENIEKFINDLQNLKVKFGFDKDKEIKASSSKMSLKSNSGKTNNYAKRKEVLSIIHKLSYTLEFISLDKTKNKFIIENKKKLDEKNIPNYTQFKKAINFKLSGWKTRYISKLINNFIISNIKNEKNGNKFKIYIDDDKFNLHGSDSWEDYLNNNELSDCNKYNNNYDIKIVSSNEYDLIQAADFLANTAFKSLNSSMEYWYKYLMEMNVKHIVCN